MVSFVAVTFSLALVVWAKWRLLELGFVDLIGEGERDVSADED